ncbi:protoplast regeneration and killer toxin resistance [Magnaporthiopsis poae ATCC 64411]|uniref:Protoplast regeneration and killer toxin resistance n=1 Tax=Magnaporthiopsis poae (strain ATCC 64411 / 73-15) TaxID=644358 RepID=A0A0C4EAL5_MAGP6|nr:protoplast regeneration and killer toxin resistance [Magnaporthiopsis poae ATCC 64411]
MAAVTRSPPPSASPSSSPTRRKPLPLHDLPQIPQQRFDWDDGAVKPLPNVPLSVDSPRLRHPPRSPVRVNIKPDNWAQPSNATIERHDDALPPLPRRLDRELPKTPDAPTPPPHTPVLEDKQQQPQQQQQQQQQQHPDGHNLQHQQKHSMADEQAVRSVPSGSELQPTTVTTSAMTAAKSDALVSPGGSVSSSSRFVQADGRPPSSRMQKGKAPEDRDDLSPRDRNRDSRETASTVSTTQTQQQASTTSSSAVTTASSASGAVADHLETLDLSADPSPEGSIIEPPVRPESVPQLQYHHQQFLPRPPTIPAAAQEPDQRGASTPDLLENAGNSINRHLTPNQFMRRSSMPRPQSVYSVYSDRGRSPMAGGGHMRAPSAQSRRSPDVRYSTYSDMLDVPYPQPAPAPIPLDNSQLRTAVGTNASLLSTQKTLEMYRQNVKKTNDPSIQYSFAVFLISTAQELGFDPAQDPGSSPATKRRGSPKIRQDSTASPASYLEPPTASPHELVREAKSILQKLASSGYPFAQYYLADGYASGLFSKGKEDYNAAFPLFVLAAKHGHAESGYRTGLCYEFGWGCRKDPAKAVQFLRTAASKRHPGAMNRLGKACLSGDLGERRYREGIKWLKLATEAADTIYNAAPYHLGCLYETGYGDDIFLDESYAAELFTQAADLGHPEASFRMGDAYEHGRLNCPRDPALSVHFYTGAAERGHAGAMMGLCAWYMVGAEPILEKDEEEAYEWAHRAADLGNVKAQYAVGYFTEMGIGCRRDILEANVWYVKAADAGDERAKLRLAAIRAAVSGGTPMDVAAPRNGKIKKSQGEKDESCVIM